MITYTKSEEVEIIPSEGHVGCLIVAGGMGTRLGFTGPKGLYPLDGKTLFERLFSRISHVKGPIAVMTSPLNHEETVAYFAKNNNFGLPHLDCFPQGMLPLLDTDELPFDEYPGKPALGPDGNGYALKLFYEAGLWEKWHALGVDTLHFIPVDNLLATPLDPLLTSFHRAHKPDITIQAVLREDPEEKVGVLVENGDDLQVIEYSELEDRSLKNPLANISQFCFSMDFVKSVAPKELPFHRAFKRAKKLSATLSIEPIAWKRETFIFDLLPFATTTQILLTDRSVSFAPFKEVL